MAPTYKDLAKSWLSNWLPSVCVQRLRKSVPLVCAYVCVSALIRKKESWLRPGGRGHKLCFDRYTKIEEIGSFSFRIGLPRISILLDRPSKFEYNNQLNKQS